MFIVGNWKTEKYKEKSRFSQIPLLKINIGNILVNTLPDIFVPIHIQFNTIVYLLFLSYLFYNLHIGGIC